VVKARKRFGQHFLEPAWVEKLVTAIAPQPSDHFIEIGPGRGAITAPLATLARRVTVIEVDRDLAAALEAHQWPNVTVVNADVLQMDLVSLVVAPAEAASLRIAGNLPYNISRPSCSSCCRHRRRAGSGMRT
jgi:16S rRNA (adenine1518-N6/adenine1519-N6)-dimethyltransferase